MGGPGSGRKDRTTEIINSMKGQSFEPKQDFGGMYIPNLSGDHSRGRVLTTPTTDTEIANKKYVDDQVGSGLHVLKAGDTMTGSLAIAANISNHIVLSTTDTNDPSIHFVTTNSAHDFDLHLAENTTPDCLTMEGHTVGLDTEILILALSGQAATFHLKGGDNEAHFKMDSSGDLEILNENTDKDIVFKYTHAAETHTITFNAENNKIMHSVGAFDFDNDNIITTGTLAAGATTITGNISATGNLILTDVGNTIGTTANPGQIQLGIGDNVSFAGTVSITGDLEVTGGDINSDSGAISFGDENLSTTGTLAAGATTITGALTTTGSVGIGTTSPDTNLDVAGSADDIGITVQNAQANSRANLFLKNDAQTWRMFTNTNDNFVLQDSTSGDVLLNFAKASQGGGFKTTAISYIFNENADDMDFRIEGEGDVNLFRCDASTNSVGIGIAASNAKLHVDQTSTTGAKPVLLLDQADISEEIIQFATTIGTGNTIEAIGTKVLTTTHFIKVKIPGGLIRYIPVGTIATP